MDVMEEEDWDTGWVDVGQYGVVEDNKMPYNLTNTRLLVYDVGIGRELSEKVKALRYTEYNTVACIACNLLSCIRKDRKLVYSRNKSEKCRNKKNITVAKVKKAVDYLEKEGYIVNFIGKPSKQKDERQMSYIVPTLKFVEEFCDSVEIQRMSELAYQEAYAYIELRNEDKEPVIFRKTKLTRRLESVVKKINILNEICTVRDVGGNILNNFYCRVFNNDFGHGGRFYRADVLRLPHSDGRLGRYDITINGNPVVEVDYSNLHFRLAAVREGLDIEAVHSDVYMGILNEEEKTESNRAIVKLAVNIMFNSLDEAKAISAIQKEINFKFKDRDDFTLKTGKEVFNRVKNAYPEFDSVFCNGDGYGSVLQNYDSELAACVLDVMVNKNIPCLPVHDSFIVERKHQRTLEDAMGDSFRKLFQVDVMVPVGVGYRNEIGEVEQYKILV
jgi:hypothetical protein